MAGVRKGRSSALRSSRRIARPPRPGQIEEGFLELVEAWFVVSGP
jgi:hypothetical protein